MERLSSGLSRALLSQFPSGDKHIEKREKKEKLNVPTRLSDDHDNIIDSLLKAMVFFFGEIAFPLTFPLKMV